MELSNEEIRVLGCLIEKQMTTPDYYPMTQNALLNACNQATSRDPVVDYSDSTVIAALNDLRDHGLARAVHVPGQRSVKYRHVIDEALDLRPPEMAVVAVLLLRGDQTAGELRSRTSRYTSFSGPAQVTELLEGLARRTDPLAVQLERRPGEKESRWRHLLGGGDSEPARAPASVPADAKHDLGAEVAALSARVADLELRIAALEPPATSR